MSRRIEVGKALYTAVEDNQVVLDASTDWAAVLSWMASRIARL